MSFGFAVAKCGGGGGIEQFASSGQDGGFAKVAIDNQIAQCRQNLLLVGELFAKLLKGHPIEITSLD